MWIVLCNVMNMSMSTCKDTRKSLRYFLHLYTIFWIRCKKNIEFEHGRCSWDIDFCCLFAESLLKWCQPTISHINTNKRIFPPKTNMSGNAKFHPFEYACPIETWGFLPFKPRKFSGNPWRRRVSSATWHHKWNHWFYSFWSLTRTLYHVLNI